MQAIQIELTFEQLVAAVRHLPKALKFKLYEMLKSEFEQQDLDREFRRALNEVREAYKHVPESEIEADVDLALEQIRAENSARRS
jgi:hypothetical protein